MSEIKQYLSPAQVDSELTQSAVSFRPHKSLTQLGIGVRHSKGYFSRQQDLLGTTPPWEAAMHKDSCKVSQAEGLTQPMKGPTAVRTQLKQETVQYLQETLLEYGAQVTWKIVPLRARISLLHKTIITRWGLIVHLPNTQRRKMRRQRNMPQLKEQEKFKQN